MTHLKTLTINDIRSFDPKPCYDPGRWLPEDWTGTALDILRVTDCPAEDRLWVVCHEGVIDDRTLRLFAVWCARQALALIDNPDPRRIAACDVAEQFANGHANRAELAAARDAARDAAWAAARDVAWDAAWAAARAAAWDAAWSAARAAAWAAARAAAWDAARDDQVISLIEMLESQS